MWIHNEIDQEVEGVWMKGCLTVKLQLQLVSGG